VYCLNKDFFLPNVSVAKNVADEIICIKSDNDPFITQQALNSFANDLGARVINIPNGGHFNSSAGYTQFEELLQVIK
jgi:predicted alpha/beta hydrolase family esterase